MIKRIRFATFAAGTDTAAFPGTWRSAAAGAVAAPPEIRPVRVAVCTSLPELLADPRHVAVSMEWFADAEHLGRFEQWLAGPDGRAAMSPLEDAIDLAASPVVVADEHVQRGADWLERRWRDGGVKLKHMAIAVRAAGVTAAEVSERWMARAGRIGASRIPEESRGLAYVQNHPRPRAAGEWAYDACNEVWFDDVDALRARIAYFETALDGGTERDLFRESWFLVVREEVVWAQS